MWTQWVAYCIVSFLCGGLFSLPIGLAFWAALSNGKPLTRLGVILAFILCLGFFFDSSQPDADRVALLLGLGFLACMIWVIPYRFVQIVLGLAAIGVAIWCIGYAVSQQTTQWESIVPLGMPVLAVACCVILLRFAGFRILKLTGRYTDREVEIGTGRSVDDWVRLFSKEDGLQMRREEVVRIAREDGAPFAWQRVIADAVDVVGGRTVIGKDEVGRPQTIARQADVRFWDLFSRSEGRFRWSIAQVMFLSMATAVIAAVFRALGVTFPDLMGSLFLIAISVALATVGSAVVFAFLNLHRRWRVDLICAAVIVLTSIAASCLSSLHPGFQGWAAGLLRVVVSGYLGFATAFSLGTILVRHRGYRLVLVGRGRLPVSD